MNKYQIQFIANGNKKEWAILPYELFARLADQIEMLDDINLYDKSKQEDDDFRIPSEVTFAIIDGTHPIRAWREYRGLTQDTLAKAAQISKPYLSQIETGKRHGTLAALKALCDELNIPLDVLSEK